MKLDFLSSEKLYIIIITVLILVFNLAPYVYQQLHAFPDKTYIGSFPIIIDKPVYMAEMTQGAEGNWLFTYNYTTELKTKTFIYIFYILLGHIAAFLNLPLETIFFLSRFFFGIILIFTIIYFIRYFIESANQRKFAYFFAFFATGVGFLTLNPYALDLWMPDFMPMVRFSYFPHMVLANILLLAIFLLFFHSLKTKNFNLAVWAGIFGFILNILLPYHNFIIYSVITLFALTTFIQNKDSFKKHLPNILIFFALSLPSFFYMTYMGVADPFWKEVAKYNFLPTPNIQSVLSGYGMILLFSLIGIGSMFKNKNPHSLFFTLWISSTLLLAYAPFIPMQRRVLETGLFVGLAITASFGVTEIYNRFKSSNPKNAIFKMIFIFIFILPVMFFDNIINWLAFTHTINDKDNLQFYVPNENVEAMQWLRQNSSFDSIVLSSYYNGNIMPYYANRMTYIGHGLMTIDFEKKAEKVQNFYAAKYSQTAMTEFLKENGIDYIFFSDEEKKIGNSQFNPAELYFLKNIYQNDKVIIYKFEL